MNKEDIIDYVAQTPYNSNKKVLDDMLDTLMDDNILQSDWNQNDESAKDYIKNRPFYEESSLQHFDLTDKFTFKSETNDGITLQSGSGTFTLPFVFTIGETYKFIINGTEYESICRDISDTIEGNTNTKYFGFGDVDAMIEGNIAAINFVIKCIYLPPDDPGVSRSLDAANEFNMFVIVKTDSEITEFAIDAIISNIVKIDKKYLSGLIGMSSTGAYSEIFNNYSNNIASGNYSHAEGRKTKATGNFSHAEGQETIASGNYSHAEGFETEATNEYSHAEGQGTEATGYSSHAEGSYTDATGNSSHAEGNGARASGYSSHAEGKGVTASGRSSHAEGEGDYTYITITGDANTKIYTVSAHSSKIKIGGILKYNNTDAIITDYNSSTRIITIDKTLDSTNALNGIRVRLSIGVAYGDCSHAEGKHTAALGIGSHTEGDSTIASGDNQHAQGKYNINDINNTYAHIVGNGTSDTARSNAHTLDWSGNAWYAGSVEGTAIILKSPNGTRFNISVGDDGVLSATEIIE